MTRSLAEETLGGCVLGIGLIFSCIRTSKRSRLISMRSRGAAADGLFLILGTHAERQGKFAHFGQFNIGHARPYRPSAASARTNTCRSGLPDYLARRLPMAYSSDHSLSLRADPDMTEASTPPVRTRQRDPRLDFFRGLALWFIFVDHIPSN